MPGQSYICFGREPERAALHALVNDPEGKAVLVVGPRGIGKTTLINKVLEEVEADKSTPSVTMSFQLTKDDEARFFLGMILADIEAAIQLNAHFLSVTPRGRAQLNALIDVVPKAKEIRELFMALKARSERHPRDEFIQLLSKLSELLPNNGRIIIALDANRRLHSESDDTWRVIIENLPSKVILLFGQRPDDVVARSSELLALPNVYQVPKDGRLHSLNAKGTEELIDWAAKELGRTTTELSRMFKRYEGHPYALMGAVGLLRDGLPPEVLPSDPTPEKIAAAQWNQVKDKHGPDAIRLFKAHAILEVPASDLMARRVSGIDVDQHEALLASRFIDSLLRKQGEVRAIYHSILRTHILECLDEGSERELHKRIATIYRKILAESTKTQVATDSTACARAFIHVEASSGLSDAVVVFVNECTTPLRRLGLYEAIENATANYLAVVARDSPEEAALTANLGLVLLAQGKHGVAERSFRRALEIDEKCGNHQGIAKQLTNLGTVFQERGQLQAAEDMYRKSVDMLKGLGLEKEAGRGYGNLATILHLRGKPDEAEEMDRKALDLAIQSGNLDDLAQQYSHIGVLLRDKGKLSEAESMHQKALELNLRLDHQAAIANEYDFIGIVLAKRADFEESEKMHRMALEINERLNRPAVIARNLGNIGVALHGRGDLPSAEAMFRKALQINHDIGRLEGVVQQYGNIAVLMQQRDDLPGAEVCYRRALEAASKLGRQESIAIQKGNLGTLLVLRGDYKNAEILFFEALRIDESLGRIEGIAGDYANLGGLSRRRDDYKEARSYWCKARDLFAQLGAQHKVEQMQSWIDELPDSDE